MESVCVCVPLIQKVLHFHLQKPLPGIQHESSVSVVRVVLNVNVRVSKTAIRKQLTHSLQAIPTGQVF